MNLLGTELNLTYAPTLATADAAYALARITAVCQLIDSKTTLLDDSLVMAIRQIKSFTVAGHNDYLGATGCGCETLSIQYIHACSDAWLASLFAHEGQHYLNHGKYKGDERWLDEKQAGTTQLSVGRVVGFSSGEISYLERWIADSNQAAMQQHMQQGFTD